VNRLLFNSNSGIGFLVSFVIAVDQKTAYSKKSQRNKVYIFHIPGLIPDTEDNDTAIS